MRRLFVLPLLLFIFGAGPTTYQHYNGQDAATLNLYQMDQAGPGAAVIFMDGLPLVRIYDLEAVTTVKVPPGKHLLWATIPTMNIAPISVDLNSGGSCYLVTKGFSIDGPVLEQISKESFEEKVRWDAAWKERGRGK